ncbi:phosphocholine-specific phospholipase C [Nocardioides psychrotolerans]|uniref:phospholipase C n=1 Tax=Nocardioides psychrotolerans TaxID=1005945 RepID=A0A1I3EPX7_9ACTN|nr:phospholipase C, phosphocholine-specific [Nocardioides psychrotolerans]SFI01045.1 phospholipase C [Nocardioides psychrotolerans]
MTDSRRPEASRRQVIKTGGAAAGLAVAGSLLPPSMHRAMAAPMRAGGLGAIEHVILLMQENRSFDHYYGNLRGVRGYGDRTRLRRRVGSDVMHQPVGPAGQVLPFSVREAAVAAGRPATDIQYLGDLPHGFSDATLAWADGWWDGWVPAKGAATMTYYDRDDVPLQYELAETFTTFDAYHCSAFGSTNPNRNYFWSGTTGYEPDGVRRAVTNAAYSYSHGGYDWTTYPERLEQADVSWQIYQEWDNFTDNAVEYFLPFKRIGTKMLAHVDGSYRTTEEFYDSLHVKPAAEQDRLLAQLEEGRAALSAEERSLFDKAMYRSRPGTLLTRVRDDLAAGTLPKVTWLVPTAALSEHPGASTPVGSANLIYDLLDIVASDLDTWSKTATMINFDENDGFFDHVPPPVAPRPASGNGNDWYLGQPIGLGPRVPMTIVSPWTIGGHVDSSVADHTSTLRFLEKWTGVAEPNISAWRRAVCSDLTSAFDFTRTGSPPSLSQPDSVPAPVSRWRPVPPADQELPEQETGRSGSRRLAYSPTMSAGLTGGVLRLRLGNTGSEDLAAHVYGFAGELQRPEHLLVPAGEQQELAVRPAIGRWDLAVQGPNQYWYELAGSLSGAAAGVDVRQSTRARRSSVELTLTNEGSARVILTVRPLAYAGATVKVKLAPGGSREIAWATDRGWYDVEVVAAEDATFRRRVTGRLETSSRGVTA